MAGKKSKQSKVRRRRRRIAGRVFTLCLCLTIVICLSVIAFTPGSDVAAQPSDIVDEGLVRVLLRSLGNPGQLGIKLDGVYSVDGDAGFRFQKGTEIAVSESGGELYLSSGGLTINMGGSFTLKRHAPEKGSDAGGLTIYEAEKQNLYAGDLLLSSTGSGIKSILTVQMEDYLYGVVAYEMNDSFPLEALKAQTIAARTYALRAKLNRSSYEYDVTDTTSDQVYYGYDPSYKNVVKAVDATRGIVCMFDGRPAECLYTASNGGQTAAADQIWDNRVSYLTMHDDPYDVENPYSLSKTSFLPSEPEENSEIALTLAGRLAEDVGRAQEEISIAKIVSAVPSDPDREGSKMYSSIEFGVEYTLRRDEKTVTEDVSEEDGALPVTVTDDDGTRSATVSLPTYGLLKPLMKLGINTVNYEVFEVEDAENGFTLISRRFGHGAGMSQRGAQTMAGQHGKSCEEILEFYYPGTELYEIRWSESSLKKLSELPSGVGYNRVKPTPRPTQAPLPEAKDGEYVALVSLQSSASTLNVRSAPTTAGDIVSFLYNGEKVLVTGEFDDNWVSVKTAEFSGYVKADYLTDTKGAPLVK